MSPELKTRVINEIDIKENGEYQILNISDFKSPDKQVGLKVELKSLDEKDKQKYSTILWQRKETGVTSKLGAFIVALSEMDEEGNPTTTNTDSWIGRKIRVLDWQAKKRRIVTLEED